MERLAEVLTDHSAGLPTRSDWSKKQGMSAAKFTEYREICAQWAPENDWEGEDLPADVLKAFRHNFVDYVKGDCVVFLPINTDHVDLHYANLEFGVLHLALQGYPRLGKKLRDRTMFIVQKLPPVVQDAVTLLPILAMDDPNAANLDLERVAFGELVGRAELSRFDDSERLLVVNVRGLSAEANLSHCYSVFFPDAKFLTWLQASTLGTGTILAVSEYDNDDRLHSFVTAPTVPSTKPSKTDQQTFSLSSIPTRMRNSAMRPFVPPFSNQLSSQPRPAFGALGSPGSQGAPRGSPGNGWSGGQGPQLTTNDIGSLLDAQQTRLLHEVDGLLRDSEERTVGKILSLVQEEFSNRHANHPGPGYAENMNAPAVVLAPKTPFGDSREKKLRLLVTEFLKYSIPELYSILPATFEEYHAGPAGARKLLGFLVDPTGTEGWFKKDNKEVLAFDVRETISMTLTVTKNRITNTRHKQVESRSLSSTPVAGQKRTRPSDWADLGMDLHRPSPAVRSPTMATNAIVTENGMQDYHDNRTYNDMPPCDLFDVAMSALPDTPVVSPDMSPQLDRMHPNGAIAHTSHQSDTSPPHFHPQITLDIPFSNYDLLESGQAYDAQEQSVETGNHRQSAPVDCKEDESPTSVLLRQMMDHVSQEKVQAKKLKDNVRKKGSCPSSVRVTSVPDMDLSDDVMKAARLTLDKTLIPNKPSQWPIAVAAAVKLIGMEFRDEENGGITYKRHPSSNWRHAAFPVTTMAFFHVCSGLKDSVFVAHTRDKNAGTITTIRGAVALIAQAVLAEERDSAVALAFFEAMKTRNMPGKVDRGLEGPLNPSKPEGRTVCCLRHIWVNAKDCDNILWDLYGLAVRFILLAGGANLLSPTGQGWDNAPTMEWLENAEPSWMESIPRDLLEAAYSVNYIGQDAKVRQLKYVILTTPDTCPNCLACAKMSPSNSMIQYMITAAVFQPRPPEEIKLSLTQSLQDKSRKYNKRRLQTLLKNVDTLEGYIYATHVAAPY
ncbi:uncharacterized protein EV422DRAFT_502474 [Fimicolochytrium jonesii]|uniref:uncharacterized protein n=1 Tax=Fimicolochytrium jonesii TaxID=1396493 RepID=UPI0022FEB2C6|nr:uncharacterized protein EV422DRAFT_502474 [Fimicolochytrium jonesii]KAI8826711.1 hypothetical protein EV422DRAFT_502474 [Fimicolochytrium jonesii]